MRKSALVGMFAFLSFAVGRVASAQPFVYVVTASQQFGVVDLATGAFQPIGAPTAEPQANLVWANGSLLSLSVSGNLVRINPSTGESRIIGPTGLGYNAFDLAGVAGRLYATDFGNNVYSIDSDTGAATLMQASGISPDPEIPFTLNADGTFNLCDESFYGVGGKLYATFDAFAIDPNRADATFLATTTFVQPTLYEIDPFTGAARSVGPTDLQLASAFDVDGVFYGFRLVISDFVDGFPVGRSQLVSLDLTTGKTTFIRDIDPAAGPIFGAAPVRIGRPIQPE